MKTFFILCCFVSFSQAQNLDSLIRSYPTMLKELVSGDSIVFYQCHVEEAKQQLTTVSGQTLNGSPQKYSITEKYVIVRRGSEYTVNYYTSSLTVFPNRKFSGLKIRERPYWAFVKVKSFALSADFLKVLLALENKGREATEFDFAITKYTTNQLIIKHRKNFKQLVIDRAYVISKGLATL